MHSLNLKIAAVALGLGAFGAAPASAAVVPAGMAVGGQGTVITVAAPAMVGERGQAMAQSNVEKVQRRFRSGPRFRGGRHYRGGRYYRRGGSRWIGPAIIAGTAALILGGSIEASRAGYRDRWDRCADEFVSFRWSDGTYQPFEGPRRLCPYLRR